LRGDFQAWQVQHWPSFGVAFIFMGLVGTFAGMSAFEQLGRLAAANINNHLTTKNDPNRKYKISAWTAGMYCKQSFPGQAMDGDYRPIPVF
jgi:hypothetical protein